MAGIDSLLAGGAKSLAKDKASEYLPPQLRELLPLVLNPQGYLMGKAVSSLADVLGYGNEVQDLQQGAKSEKDYYKETMRDALGDVLPGALGDFVRATPNTPYEPVGSYWDPEQNSFVNPNQNNLDPTGQTVSSNEELREGLYGTITPLFPNFVGPQEENSQADQIGMQFLPEELGVKPSIQSVNQSDIMNVLNSMSQQTEPTTEYSKTGYPGGIPGYENYDQYDYSNGGQIYRGIR